MSLFDRLTEMAAQFFQHERDVGVPLEESDIYAFKDWLGKEPLYTVFPYESYDSESMIFHNKNSYAFLLESSPLIGANEENVDILHGLIVDNLPSGTTVDIQLVASHKIRPPLEAFYALRSQRGGIYEKLAKHRMKFLEKGALKSLVKESAYLVRDFQIFIGVTIPKSNHGSETHELISLRDNVIASFKSIGMQAESIAINRFLSVMFDLINPNSHTEPTPMEWNPHESLSRQITDPEQELQVKKDGVCFDNGWQVRCLHPVKYPKTWPQWAMGDLIGDAFRDTARIPCPFVLKETIYILDRDKSERRAALKGARGKQLADSKVAMFMPKARKISASWDFVINRLEEGERIVGLMFQVILYAENKKAADRAETATKDLFRAKGWKLNKPRMLQFPSWLASLPMIMGDGLVEDMRFFNLMHTKVGYNAANLAPLQGEWKGLDNPLITLTARRGQIMWWDPWANQEGNYNIAVAGKSRSGKSVLLQEIMIGLVGSGGRAFVIDIGRSFQKVGMLLGAEVIEFEEGRDISLNMFTHITDFKESLAMLKPLVGLMVAPTRKTTDYENALIEQALLAVWEKSGTKSEITDVSEWLLKHTDERANDLGTMLFPYTRDGSYGRFFAGRCTLDLDNPFVLLELEGLSAKKDLQEVVLCLIMYHVTEVMYRGDRKQRIGCFIDEAWDIFEGEQGGKFVETGYRRAGKYNGSFISGTQGINDYYKNSATIAAFENSDWLALLAQKEESIKQLKQSDKLVLDGHLERLVNSIHTVHGAYSEVLIKGPSSYAVGRLVLDRYSQILTSSKAEEFSAVEALQKRGFSVGEAIEQLAGESIHE